MDGSMPESAAPDVPTPRAGYQGEPGSFSARAAARAGRPVAHATFDRLLRSLLAGEIDVAVLPAATHGAGPVVEPLEALARVVEAGGGPLSRQGRDRRPRPPRARGAARRRRGGRPGDPLPAARPPAVRAPPRAPRRRSRRDARHRVRGPARRRARRRARGGVLRGGGARGGPRRARGGRVGREAERDALLDRRAPVGRRALRPRPPLLRAHASRRLCTTPAPRSSCSPGRPGRARRRLRDRCRRPRSRGPRASRRRRARRSSGSAPRPTTSRRHASRRRRARPRSAPSTVVTVGRLHGRRRAARRDRRAVRRRVARAGAAPREGGRARGSDGAARRRLQAAHVPVRVPGPRPRGARMAARGGRRGRPADRHRGHGARAGRAGRAGRGRPPDRRAQLPELRPPEGGRRRGDGP